jgi:hypothetical protein
VTRLRSLLRDLLHRLRTGHERGCAGSGEYGALALGECCDEHEEAC